MIDTECKKQQQQWQKQNYRHALIPQSNKFFLRDKFIVITLISHKYKLNAVYCIYLEHYFDLLISMAFKWILLKAKMKSYIGMGLHLCEHNRFLSSKTKLD